MSFQTMIFEVDPQDPTVVIGCNLNNFPESISAPVVAASELLTLPVYTVATLPEATAAGQVIYVSDSSGGGALCFSNAAGDEGWIDVTTGVVVVEAE